MRIKIAGIWPPSQEVINQRITQLMTQIGGPLRRYCGSCVQREGPAIGLVDRVVQANIAYYEQVADVTDYLTSGPSTDVNVCPYCAEIMVREKLCKRLSDTKLGINDPSHHLMALLSLPVPKAIASPSRMLIVRDPERKIRTIPELYSPKYFDPGEGEFTGLVARSCLSVIKWPQD